MICTQKIHADAAVKHHAMTLSHPTVNAIAALFEGADTMKAKLSTRQKLVITNQRP